MYLGILDHIFILVYQSGKKVADLSLEDWVTMKLWFSDTFEEFLINNRSSLICSSRKKHRTRAKVREMTRIKMTKMRKSMQQLLKITLQHDLEELSESLSFESEFLDSSLSFLITLFLFV